jgi:REP element-mobilizing transposase RayT
MRSTQSNRLPDYDYSQPGAYFVTLVSRNRLPLFGELAGEEIHLSEVGNIVREEWLRTAELRPEISLDESVIMPNHFHAILFINEGFPKQEPVGAHLRCVT